VDRTVEGRGGTVPWCETCHRRIEQAELTDEQACPACGTELPARKVPWHIKVLVFATVVYLGYRGYQGVTWIIHHA
jgi:uncharacterized paraquat-inducible protein A